MTKIYMLEDSNDPHHRFIAQEVCSRCGTGYRVAFLNLSGGYFSVPCRECNDGTMIIFDLDSPINVRPLTNIRENTLKENDNPTKGEVTIVRRRED